MKCDVCGTESDFEAGFVKDRKSFRSARRTLCPACWARRRHAFEGWYQVAVLAGGIAGYILLWLNPWSIPGRFLTNLFLIDVFLILMILPHELGHALAGRLLGWRVFAVVIGLGKRAVKFRLAGIVFSFHWLPVGGITQTAPVEARLYRLKRFLVILAGPMVNVAIAGVILFIWRDEWRYFGLMALPRTARLCLWANLAVVAVNLWPHQLKTLKLDSDGKNLLKILFNRQKDIEEMTAARFVLEALYRRDEFKDSAGALDWCNQGLALFPQNVHLLNLSGLLCLDDGDYSRAREIFLQLLSRETKAERLRYTILNNIAYVDALIGTPELLAEADAYSQQAHAGAPWVPAITGTRGTVLVAMGQLEPGLKLLQESFEKAWTPRNKAENACHISIAHTRLGNREEAGKYLDLARQLDPACRLIDRAQNELQKDNAVA